MSMTQQDWRDAYAIYDHCIDAGGSSTSCEDDTQQSYPNFDAGGGGSGFGGQMSNYWGNPDNWINFTTGLTGIAGSIIGMVNGQPVYANGNHRQQQQQQQDTIWWVVGGLGVLLLILMLFIALKK